MAGTSNLPSMVPGFEFLQGLFKNAGAGLPSMGQWIAPTLDPEELDKRIQELKTVQFWLEQNARLLATTIQALEVQRMTLSTLQSMNLPLAGFGEALKIRMPSSPPDASAEPAPASRVRATPQAKVADSSPPPQQPAAQPAAAAPLAGVDPVQWWGALTQQFTELAAKAVKDASAELAAPTSASKPKSPAPAPEAAPAVKRAAARKR